MINIFYPLEIDYFNNFYEQSSNLSSKALVSTPISKNWNELKNDVHRIVSSQSKIKTMINLDVTMLILLSGLLLSILADHEFAQIAISDILRSALRKEVYVIFIVFKLIFLLQIRLDLKLFAIVGLKA